MPRRMFHYLNRPEFVLGRACFIFATFFITFLLLLSCNGAVLAASAVSEPIAVGSPPALPPGQAPPLPKPGPLAEPRSSNQVGFPTVLTKYVISPATLRPARVRIGSEALLRASALR